MVPDSLPLQFLLLIDGQPAPDWIQVQGITTRSVWQGQGSAEILLAWGVEQADALAGLLKSESGIQVKAGYGPADFVDIFSGKLAFTRLSLRAAVETTLTLVCESEGAAVVWSPTPAPALTAQYGVNLLACEATDTKTNLAGQIRLTGTARAAPGLRMKVAGLGELYDGEVWITEVEQEIKAGLWTSTLHYASQPPLEPAPSLAQTLPLEVSYDAANNQVSLILRKNLSVQLQADNASLSCADSHGNALTLDAKGIAITSAAGLNLSGKGDVTVNVPGNAFFTLGQDYRVTALNIRHNAQIALVATGGASAELSAGAQAVIKAAMVMIN